MSDVPTQQWKYALGNVLKKTAYVLGGIAFAAALIVSRQVRAQVAGAIDTEVSASVAFTASFFAYLLVIGAGGLLVHFAIWRVGHNLTQTQELTWKRDEAQTSPRAHLTSSTPVP